jgi:hypothetical protein
MDDALDAGTLVIVKVAGGDPRIGSMVSTHGGTVYVRMWKRDGSGWSLSRTGYARQYVRRALVTEVPDEVWRAHAEVVRHARRRLR